MAEKLVYFYLRCGQCRVVRALLEGEFSPCPVCGAGQEHGQLVGGGKTTRIGKEAPND